MPRWDFYCTQCDKTFELTFPTYEHSLNANCPNCRCGLNQGLERLPASGSFVLKGPGFYKNDYK